MTSSWSNPEGYFWSELTASNRTHDDPEVASAIVDLWEPYSSDSLESFLCGLETGFPPQYDTPGYASPACRVHIVAPLCER
jgi:hypothetical protein